MPQLLAGHPLEDLLVMRVFFNGRKGAVNMVLGYLIHLEGSGCAGKTWRDRDRFFFLIRHSRDTGSSMA
jgi:hypothetical protein